MDARRSKFVSNSMAKVRPKLPLYSKKISEKISQSKSVTMDDILRSVKTLDDTSNAKKIEKSEIFSKSDGNLKKFQPCSSLDNMNIDNTDPEFEDSCIKHEFSAWVSETDGPVTPSKSIKNYVSNEKSQRSPILLSKFRAQGGKSLKTHAKSVSSSTQDKLYNSQNVRFNSLLSTQTLLQSSLEDHNMPEENINKDALVRETIIEKVGTEQALSPVSSRLNTVIGKVYVEEEQDSRLVFEENAQQKTSMESHQSPVPSFCMNPENGETSIDNSSLSPASNSQRNYENEANAALSVFDVSDFLACSKTRTIKENLPSQIGSAKDSSTFRVPLAPPVMFDGSDVGPSSQKEKYVGHDSLGVQSLFSEEIRQEVSAVGTVNTGFTTACGRSVRVAEKSLNSASQLLERVDNDDTPASSKLKNSESGVTNNAHRIEQSEHKNSLFTFANGKSSSISSENLRKAALLSETCVSDSPKTSIVGKIAKFNMRAENVHCPERSTSEIPLTFGSLEVQPASSESLSQNVSASLKLELDTGFCTAQGKNICVSDKSLSFASSVLEFSESESKSGQSSYELTSPTAQTTNPRPTFPNSHQYRKSLFNTASGKSMTISSANLQKAKSLFDQCSDPNAEVSEPGPSRTVPETQQSNSCQNTSKMLPSVPKTIGFRNSTSNTIISQIDEITGFSTAGGKSVCVAEKSLDFASQLLESLETDEKELSNSQAYNKSHVSRAVNTKAVEYRKSLFQSASGNATSVSLANLRKAKNLFDSLDGNSSEGNSASKRLHSVGEVKNGSKSGEEHSDFCTPENTGLLDSDSELFQTIETPSKSRNPVTGCSLSTNKNSRVLPQNNEPVNCGKQNGELLSRTVKSKGELDADFHSSPTVFNESGINTQRKSCAGNRSATFSPNLLQKDISTSPKTKSLTSGQRSPILLNGSFMGTPSPRRLQHQEEMPYRGKSKNISSLGLIDEKSHSHAKLVVPSSPTLNCVTSAADVDHKRSARSVRIEPGKNANNPQMAQELEERSLENLRDCASRAPENTRVIFKSAAGKSIQVSDASLKRMKALFSDVLDEGLNAKEDGSGEMQTIEKVNTDELSSEFCCPVLLDGSFVEKCGNAHSEADDVESKLVDDDSSHSPVLNCSFVAPEQQHSLVEKVSMKSVTTPVNSNKVSLEEKVLSSPDWGEFPDLKSSQAALLEKQAETPKENIGLEANRLTKAIEWGEFPEMPNVEVCKLERTKNIRSDAQPNNTPVVMKEYVPVESGLNPINQRLTAKRSVLNSSVTIERVPTQDQGDLHQDSETSRKRKSMPNTLQSTSKKSKPSLSPQRAEEITNKLVIRKRIREQQFVIVRSKRNQRIQPSAGKLFMIKKAGRRWQLKDLDDELKTLEGNHVEVCVSRTVIDITSENSADYRFCFSTGRAKTTEFVEGELIADSCLLANADDNTAGLKEITTAFLTSPHVDPKLIPNSWIRNHYRWIVWKLACLERTFPQQFGGSCLTVENVLLQLKYRYDREIDMVQSSSFKKLLKGNAAPNKFICVVAAEKKNNLDDGESLLELELTDGWYSIWAVIDSEMVNLVKRDVVGIGTKLIVHSAELTNCEQGCDPLNVPSNVKLKISTNSVRRVKWFAKMGFTPNNNPIPALLCSVLPNGGLIGQVTAVVARIYPVIYMCKDGDGKTVFRNERSQSIFREQQEKIKSDKAEQVYEQVWKQVESKYRKSGKSSMKYTSKEIQNIADPELLFNIMDGSDAEFIQSQLSADQLRLVLQYKDEIMAKMKSDVQKVLQDKLCESEPPSKAIKLLKVRLMDFFTEKHALLTIWRPSDDDLSVLREGKAFEFLNLISSGTRDKVLQLSSTRQTTYTSNEMLEPSEDCSRRVTLLQAVDAPGFTPTFGEIDAVGVVVLVKLPEQTRGVTVVYLSDLEGHYMSVTFWTSLSVFGCDDLMTEGSIITCSNLQWRPVSNQRKVPSVFASEITSFSLNPKERHLQQGVAELKAKLADKEVGDLVSDARSHILQMTGFRDLNSSPAPSTPLSCARGTPAHKKLKLLSHLGEDTPPLSPIPLTVTTRHVFQNFKSPCRTPLGPSKSKQS